MPSGISSLCNFPLKRKSVAPIVVVPPANLLFATGFDGIAIADPTFGWAGYCDRYLTGTDLDTGHPPPTANPLYALSNGYRLSFTTQSPSPQFSPLNLGGVNAVVTATIENDTVFGQAAKVLVLTAKANATALAYNQQFWYNIYRNTTIAPDLPECTIRYDVNVGDLTTRLSSASGARRHVLADFKSGAAPGGDYRYTVQFLKASAADAANFGCAVGTVGWQLQGDSYANDGAILRETFFTVRNFSVPVPQSQYLHFELYWIRSASFADVDSGRVRLRVKNASDSDYVTILDVTKASLASYQSTYGGNDPQPGQVNTTQRNIHMGSAGRKMQRMFIAGIYGEYNRVLDNQIKITNVEIWDGDMAA